VIGLLLASLSVGLGNFAASIGIGLSGVDNRTRLKIGITFGFFEAVMPIVGLLAGADLAGPVGKLGQYAGASLLAVTGAYMIWQARHSEGLQFEVQKLGLRQLLITGLALSIDNLVVGFALSFYHVSFLLAAAIIGTMSIMLSLLGLELGQRLGTRFEAWSEELGGAVLILVALALAGGVL
jgi:manganese efflux pump family protein